MSGHWIIAPVILPAMLAPLMALAMRHDVGLQRVFSIAGTVLITVMSIGLLISSLSGEIGVYDLGDWPAPFGIVLVLDRLAALMLVLTSLLGLFVVLYVSGSDWDKRGWHFHPLFQFQLMGVNGAFLTGDAFNLFVFFEILLIASYGLMIHGGGGPRLRAGLQYVVINLGGSTLFLFALGTLYSVTGTLNMADMSRIVAELPEGEQALMRVGALILLVVFAVKAALVPLHFWLPGTYTQAPPPVAALFAIMTKVGAYSILRMYTLVFPPEAPGIGSLISDILTPAALLTLAIGAIGVLGALGTARIVSFATLASVGTLLVALSLFTEASTSAAIYYLVHSTFAAAALFLVVDLIRRSGGIPNGLTTSLYFAGAIIIAGMPPLSGFIGKLLVLDTARGTEAVWWIWAVVLVGSLLIIIGLAREGSRLFWKPWDASERSKTEMDEAGGDHGDRPVTPLALTAATGMVAMGALMTIFAGPMTKFTDATAEQLYNPERYAAAVLDKPGRPEPALAYKSAQAETKTEDE